MVRSALIVLIATPYCVASIARGDEAQVQAVLREMETSGKGFPPNRLQQLGTGGLEAVFDRLIPQSRPTESPLPLPQLLAELAANLGSDDFRLRKAAVERLTAFGELARAHVVQASRSEDPEVRLRAIEVLDEWKKLPLRRPSEADLKRNEKFREACQVSFEQIADDERLEVIVLRVSAALKVGLLDQETRQGVRICVKRLAALQQDRWFQAFEPLLDHDDPEVPLFLIHSIGAAKRTDFFPTLMLTALESDRDALVEAVLAWSLDCADQERKSALRDRLQQLLEHGKEPLKFRACWPLMRDFGDQAAFDYIVAQTKNTDSAIARVAMSWLADGCNQGKPVTPEVLAALTPQLQSGDFFLRRDAAQALATFRSEEVLHHLLPLLADEKPAIVDLVSAELIREPDRAFKRSLLEQTIQRAESDQLRQRARKVLARLDAMENQ